MMVDVCNQDFTHVSTFNYAENEPRWSRFV